MQDQAGPFAGCPPRSRSVAQMDDCSRQNPAYRFATGGAPGNRGLSYIPAARASEARRRRPPSDASAQSVRLPCEHTFYSMIVCVLLPRFELTVAAGGREALAMGPLALAPEIGREALIGETSAAAEAHGVRAGLRLGEALARCPTLRLITPDPAGVADAWERIIAALEGIGAAVESPRAAIPWLEERGLRAIQGGSLESVIAMTRRALGGSAPPDGRRGGAASDGVARSAAASADVARIGVATSGV